MSDKSNSGALPRQVLMSTATLRRVEPERTPRFTTGFWAWS